MPVKRPENYTPVGSPTQQTSTGTADVKTFTPPAGQTAFIVTVATTSCRLTTDGTTPDATHGITVQAGAQPLLLPIAAFGNVKIASTAAANSVVDVQYLN
jgi:hypothetical protein